MDLVGTCPKGFGRSGWLRGTARGDGNRHSLLLANQVAHRTENESGRPLLRGCPREAAGLCKGFGCCDLERGRNRILDLPRERGGRRHPTDHHQGVSGAAPALVVPVDRAALPGLEDALISNARRRGSAGGRHITWGWDPLAASSSSSRVSTGHHLLSHNFGSRIAGRYRGCVGVPSLFIRR